MGEVTVLARSSPAGCGRNVGGQGRHLACGSLQVSFAPGAAVLQAGPPSCRQAMCFLLLQKKPGASALLGPGPLEYRLFPSLWCPPVAQLWETELWFLKGLCPISRNPECVTSKV